MEFSDMNQQAAARAEEIRAGNEAKQRELQEVAKGALEYERRSNDFVQYLTPEGISIQSASFLEKDSKLLLRGLIKSIDASGKYPTEELEVYRSSLASLSIAGQYFDEWKQKAVRAAIPDKSDRMWHVSVQDHTYEVDGFSGKHIAKGHSTLFADGTIRAVTLSGLGSVYYSRNMKQAKSAAMKERWRYNKNQVEMTKASVIDVMAKHNIEWIE